MPTNDELRTLQALPIEIKIAKTKLRIREWINYWGVENCYVSFSGGKDSTVLLDIVRQEYPSIPAVFVDTGLEYPEIKAFVRSFDNVVKLKPDMNFRDVILKYGYPIISKNIAHIISGKQRGAEWANKYFYDSNRSMYNVPKQWRYLGDEKLFKISERCCDIMKKKPAHKYSKETGRHPILGTTCEESQLRTQKWLKQGCNAFEGNSIKSAPMSFWTEQDVLKYIYENKLQIAPVYGEIVCVNGKYETTGVKRTGCVFCGFGVHREKEPNRYQQLHKTHPKLWEYCMKPVESGGLGFQQVMDIIGVPTKFSENLFGL